MAISEKLEFLDTQVVGVAVFAIKQAADTDVQTAAHALGIVSGPAAAEAQAAGAFTVDLWLNTMDAAVMVARDLKYGKLPCEACEQAGQYKWFHRIEPRSSRKW
jgi:hypothetical protein